MKRMATLVTTPIGLVCVAVLAISIYPGVLNDLLWTICLLACPVVVVAMFGGVIALAWFAWSGRLTDAEFPRRQVGVTLVILVVTLGLLVFYVPRRIAFAASRPAFEALVAQTPQTDGMPAACNQRLGVYQVDEYSADSRGGVYFRVYVGADGSGPDTMSYGFCYQPNASGTPFGAASYETYNLGGGWCWFRVSNDWH